MPNSTSVPITRRTVTARAYPSPGTPPGSPRYGEHVGWWTEHAVPRITDLALRGHEVGESRARTCAELSGRVLEIGFGSGLNLAHLPQGVTGVGAVEPSDVGWSMSEKR